MPGTMISFNAGGWRFHLRAAAVVRDGDRVLLHRLRAGLDQLDLRPPFLRQSLRNTSAMGVQHIVQDDSR